MHLWTLLIFTKVLSFDHWTKSGSTTEYLAPNTRRLKAPQNFSLWFYATALEGHLTLVLALLLTLLGNTTAQAVSITGFYPTEAIPRTVVRIQGQDIRDATTVEFNGHPAVWVTPGFDGTGLDAMVPNDATTGPITVRTPNGSATSEREFKVLPWPAPEIWSVEPNAAPPGRGIRILGTNIWYATSVEFNGTKAQTTYMVDDLIAVVPAGAITGPITVRTPGGVVTTTNDFTVLPPPTFDPPVVSSFDPQSGPPGTLVVINGSNFVGLIKVSFNGGIALAAPFFATDPIQVRVPTNALTGPITVTSDYGSVTTTESFTVLPAPPPPPPALGFFQPFSGAVGDQISISGANFDRVTEVRFNGVPATFELHCMASPCDWINATVPAGATTGPITVTSPEGSSTWMTGTWLREFTVISVPRVTGFEPSKGPPGTIVKLIGEDLVDITGVVFGGFTTKFDPTNHSFVVPPQAVTGVVTVYSPNRTVESLVAFEVTHELDLQISTHWQPTNAIAPTEFVCSVHVKNKGPSPVSAVRVTNNFVLWDTFTDAPWPVPERILTRTRDSVSVSSVIADGGIARVLDQSVECSWNKLEPFGEATMTISFQIGQPGVIYFVSSAYGAEQDPDVTDNLAVAEARISSERELRISILPFRTIEVRWPDSTGRSVLEVSDSAEKGTWLPAVTDAVVDNGWRTLRTVIDAKQKFYRFVTPEPDHRSP